MCRAGTRMLIYLADLGHNLLTYSSDVYPLAVANVATYTRAGLRSEVAPTIRLFREPQDLKKALDDAPPDVLGLSNYAWNQELSKHFGVYAKRRSPETLTLMGGPNWPLTPDIQESFLRDLPDVDAYIDGPTYEGERGFLNALQRFCDSGCARGGLFEEPVPGTAWIDPATDEYVRGGPVERIRDLDEIPSPYLGGWMDAFFSTGYFPMLQISRGCPFTCQFCNSSVESNNRVYAHSVENVKRDLLYIAERIKPEITCCFADDNFGMYKRDEEIADYIGWLQKRYHWPRYIRTTTGKNNGDRIIRVMRKMNGILPMTAAVQSMNPEVLKNIRRSNIKLDTYKDLQEELERWGMQSYGELILCLPGETRQSFMSSVEQLLDSGAKRISAHQLMLLHGAPLANPDQRAKFGFETRHRVVARNIGDYTDEPLVEVEEMVVETPTFSYQDYLETRTFHMLLTIFFYEGNFEEAFEFARQHGVSAYRLVVAMQEMLDEAPAEFKHVMDDFLHESGEELFATREACLDWAHEHYAELVDGSVGGNLLSKYSMIGRFYATQPALDFLQTAISKSCASEGSAADPTELDVLMSYLRAVILHVPFAQALDSACEWTPHYDVEAWASDGYGRPLSEYRRDAATPIQAVVDPERRALIQTKVETFGEHPSGLGKFTRTIFARDLRRSFQSNSTDLDS